MTERGPTFNEMMLHARETARSEIVKFDELLPMATFRTPSGIAIGGMMMATTTENIAAMRLLALDQHADAVVFRVEMWIAKVAEGDPLAARLMRREIEVRELPADRRLDGLLIYGEQVGRPQQVEAYEITSGRTDLLRYKASMDQMFTRFYPILPGNMGRPR